MTIRVVVADDQHTIVGVSAKKVNSRVERVASVQPPDPGLMAIRAAAKAHAGAQGKGRAHVASSSDHLMYQANHVSTVGRFVKGVPSEGPIPAPFVPLNRQKHAEDT